MQEVSFKKSWRAPGLVNKEFNKIPILNPVVLDQWTRARIQMPERGYEKFALSKLLIQSFLKLANKPMFKPTDSNMKEFGDPSIDLLSKNKREEVIKLIQSGFTEGR